MPAPGSSPLIIQRKPLNSTRPTLTFIVTRFFKETHRVDYAFPKPFAVFKAILQLKSNDKTTDVKYWHFGPEIETFQKVSSPSSLHGQRPLTMCWLLLSRDTQSTYAVWRPLESDWCIHMYTRKCCAHNLVVKRALGTNYRRSIDGDLWRVFI